MSILDYDIAGLSLNGLSADDIADNSDTWDVPTVNLAGSIFWNRPGATEISRGSFTSTNTFTFDLSFWAALGFQALEFELFNITLTSPAATTAYNILWTSTPTPQSISVGYLGFRESSASFTFGSVSAFMDTPASRNNDTGLSAYGRFVIMNPYVSGKAKDIIGQTIYYDSVSKVSAFYVGQLYNNPGGHPQIISITGTVISGGLASCDYVVRGIV